MQYQILLGNIMVARCSPVLQHPVRNKLQSSTERYINHSSWYLFRGMHCKSGSNRDNCPLLFVHKDNVRRINQGQWFHEIFKTYLSIFKGMTGYIVAVMMGLKCSLMLIDDDWIKYYWQTLTTKYLFEWWLLFQLKYCDCKLFRYFLPFTLSEWMHYYCQF